MPQVNEFSWFSYSMFFFLAMISFILCLSFFPLFFSPSFKYNYIFSFKFFMLI